MRRASDLQLRYKHIFWDWNGTLADDLQTSLDAVNKMLAKRGRAGITVNMYYEYIDTPISRFYARVEGLSELPMELIMAEFAAFYTSAPFKLMAGAREVLAAVKESGAEQYLLTSSSYSMVEPYIERLGLSRYFTGIIASRDDYCLGKSENACAFVRDNGINPRDCVIIGDTLHDFETARAVGCECVLIPNGHQAESDLSACGGNIIGDIKNIPRFLRGEAPGGSGSI